jgi:DNA-binding FadR family transcriptional regulator
MSSTSNEDEYECKYTYDEIVEQMRTMSASMMSDRTAFYSVMKERATNLRENHELKQSKKLLNAKLRVLSKQHKQLKEAFSASDPKSASTAIAQIKNIKRRCAKKPEAFKLPPPPFKQMKMKMFD